MVKNIFSIFKKSTKTGLLPPDNDAKNSEEAVPDYYVVTDVLDLHGFFPEQVPEMLEEFLLNAAEKGYRECRIVHGKGKSKLKWITRKVLEANPFVIDYYDAPPEAGGWGATIVEIKTKP